MNKHVRYALIGAAVWSAGVFIWQRTQGLIFIGGKTIPGFLDPLGMVLGYPNAVQVTIGDPIEQ
jgi:hypothetical protein